MKFLLVAVNAKYIHSNPAIYSLYTYARAKYEHDELCKDASARPVIEIAEYTINQRPEVILARIYERRPDAIGFSCYIWNWNVISELLCDITKVLPDTDIWLGGPQVSHNAGEVMEQFPDIKGIMIGEGEETFSELLERYQRRDTQDLTSVAGLYLKTGYTAPRKAIGLDKLPFLYKDTETFANRIIYYESSRGCPYRCSYCLSSIEKTVRLRDIGTVKKELEFFLENKVKQVKFVDRTFNCVHEHAMDIWQYLYEHDNGVTNFHFEISADIITDEELEMLKKLRPGLVQLEIGVQTVNEKTLEAINRRMDLERLEYVVAKIRENHNIHQHLDLIAGLPYEDYQSFKISFDRVYAMRPDQLQLGFLKVLSGAPIAARTQEFGISYTKQPPYEVLYTRWLSYPDMIRLKKIEEMVELYYNSRQFVNTLEYLVRAFGSPFEMFEALADFFEENGYFTNSPSRAYRYEVLLDFSSEYDGGKRNIYSELLTYDLYLRENIKSRPDFCRPLTDKEYKDFRHDFYKQEEKSGSLLPGLRGLDAKALSGVTHLEAFTYPVWEMGAFAGETSAGETFAGENFDGRISRYVLFDYSVRDPLTKDAVTVVLERL